MRFSNIFWNFLDKDPSTFLISLEEIFRTSSFQEKFGVVTKVGENRVLNERFEMIHKQSRIRCWLQLQSDYDLAESSQIIRNYIDFEPLCESFAIFVKKRLFTDRIDLFSIRLSFDCLRPIMAKHR